MVGALHVHLLLLSLLHKWNIKGEPKMPDDRKKARLEHLLKKSSSLSKKDLMSVLPIKNNPLSIVIIKKYTKNGKLDAQDLVRSLYAFTNAKILGEKLKFIFGLYDLDGDGCISSVELFELLKLLNKGIMEDWKLQNVVDKTFAEMGEYTTRMRYDQFEDLITKRSKNIRELFDCDE